MNDRAYIPHPVDSPIRVTGLVTIHYFEYGKDYKYPGESHDFWEIMYVDRGTVFIQCGEAEHQLSRGELILLPPNRFHSIRADDAKPSNVFIVSFTVEGEALSPLSGRGLPVSTAMKGLVHAIIQEGEAAFFLPMSKIDHYHLQARQDAPFASLQILQMRLEELLILLCREYVCRCQGPAAPKARFDDCIAARIQEFLKENRYRRLSLEDITGAMGYGKTYLSGVFKRVYGVSIMERCTQLKIDEAKYLLRENTLTAAEIADRLGFSSPQYFSRRFSQLVKMSPRQYADSVRETWSTRAK